MAADVFGRTLNYLRVSLTDRCNLRCIYCMPEQMNFKPREALLQTNELFLLTRLFAELGFSKFRLTGGEPTVRRDIVEIVRHAAQLPGVREVSMTTNGLRLKTLAEPLAEAGLKRVNISLDSPDPKQFREITRQGNISKVWQGIEAAERAGLTPIKLNAVIIRGCNDDMITDLAKLTLIHPWQVRFIELMPLGEMAPFAQHYLVSEHEMRKRIAAQYIPLEPLNDGNLDGEARLYRFPGALGTVGFISSVSQPFYASCNRIRLTADGVLRLCLLQDQEVDLLSPLRAGASQEELSQMIIEALRRKPWGHNLHHNVVPVSRMMSQIGG
ncbi:MAG: GTP 3',8-cyclase MoaA [Chloroflexi bacterium]|nr:GTP 3',8-cyclase MoaA [Chloroflexota bacterium]MDL1883173.1 GTP 3',8-cyclase MoaA [Anaerolineae bacterium CFX8]